ncbi:MAG: flagellar basal body-associated FliL family protein [Gemmatimonadaceae bacterium]|nr:flagellar basal body-associated FliL family protein [Gemmatimonadaceae bacterium]
MAQEPAPTAPDAAPAPTGMKAKLPMIAMVAVGLAVGGGTGAMFIGPMVAKKMGKSAPSKSEGKAAKDEHSEEEAPADEEAAADEEASADAEHAPEGEEKAAEASVHLLENLVLNPAGSGGSRFLLLTVAIEAGSAKVATDMTARDAELRDIILTSLGTKTVEQLTEIATRDSIKVEVQKAISARFGKKSVKRLYFPQFVVQ